MFGHLAGCSFPFRSGIDREAEMENEKFWKRLYIKCGDSYYGEVAPGLSEMRDVSFSITRLALTAIDKENGYAWKAGGRCALAADAFFRLASGAIGSHPAKIG